MFQDVICTENLHDGDVGNFVEQLISFHCSHLLKYQPGGTTRLSRGKLGFSCASLEWPMVEIKWSLNSLL